MVHKYGVQSKLSREWKVCLVGYVDSSQNEIMIDETGISSLVIMSIRGLARAFSEAVQRFFDESCKDNGKLGSEHSSRTAFVNSSSAMISRKSWGVCNASNIPLNRTLVLRAG